jgi:hypothetical protein
MKAMFLLLVLALLLPVNSAALAAFDKLEPEVEEGLYIMRTLPVCQSHGHIYGDSKQGHGGGIPCIIMDYRTCVNCGGNEPLGTQICTQHGDIHIIQSDCNTYLYIIQYISKAAIHWKTIIR